MAKAKPKKSLSFNDILRLLWKHIFWIVIPILILVAYSVKRGAQGKIKTDFETETSAVTAEKKAMDDIASNDKHPNTSTIEKVKAEKENLSQNVYKTWMLMFNDQKKRNKWPRKLSKEFLDIVENAKFEAPIGTGKQYILEDYGRMMVTNLPQLLIDMNRRRYQVRCYQFVRSDQNPNTGRFEPVYIDVNGGSAGNNPNTKPLLYLFGNEGKVYQYFQEDNYIAEIEESDRREYLLGIPKEERVDYWVETDPMITNPRNFVSSGGTGGAVGGRGREMGRAGGMAGMSDMSEMPGMPGMGPSSSLGGGSRSGGPTSIPGDGIDPALLEFSANELMFDQSAYGPNEILPGLPTYEDRRRLVGNVDWLSPEIFSLLNWGSSVPYSIEVWYLQEDLWVYQALLRVVMRSNGILSDAAMEGTADQATLAAEAKDNAKNENDKDSVANNIGKSAIKCIEQMLIGQRAAAAWLEIKKLSLVGLADMGKTDGMGGAGMGGMPGAAPGGMAGGVPGGKPDTDDMPGMPPGGTPGTTGMAGGMATMDETSVRTSLRNNRYLDALDEPLASDDPPPFAEFKRMPIVLKLVVDQRRIPEVLVNCANCSMPIDVRHVRICPENTQKVGGGPGMGGPNSRPSPGDDRAPSGGDGPSGGVSLGRTALGETSGYSSDAIRVEIYGVINIYNEPDPTIFGTGNFEGEKEGGVDGAKEKQADSSATAVETDVQAADETVPDAEAAEVTEAAVPPEPSETPSAPSAPANSPTSAEPSVATPQP